LSSYTTGDLPSILIRCSGPYPSTRRAQARLVPIRDFHHGLLVNHRSPRRGAAVAYRNVWKVIAHICAVLAGRPTHDSGSKWFASPSSYGFFLDDISPVCAGALAVAHP